MSDIVAELKAGADDFCADGPCWPGDVMIEAAMEIERLRAENSEKETMLLNQAKTIKEMQAEIEALKEALKPFAELYCGVSMRDDVAAAFTVIGTRGVDNTVITAGYIRRAREAMGEKG